MEIITQQVNKMASLEYMRVLKARGYQVTRCGLNFRVITALGAASYMTVQELSDLATEPKTWIL